MKAKQAISEISSYLKSHHIEYIMGIEEGGMPRITMVFNNCELCPGKITEGSIFFFEDGMEVRVYYSELGAKICRDSKNLSDIYRLMNFLQARLWPQVSDGMEGALYQSQHLFNPRFYITEDEMYDITTTMFIPYTHFELDILETEDFITAALPDLLNSLSVPVFLLLVGNITVDEAINMVKSDILERKP